MPVTLPTVRQLISGELAVNGNRAVPNLDTQIPWPTRVTQVGFRGRALFLLPPTSTDMPSGGLPPTWRPCEAWTMRTQAYGGPARPSPLRGEALNAGFRYLEVTCAGCDTCNTVDLTRGRRATEMPIWQLERRMRCRPCSEERGYPDQA
jgi:hypothetical protein